MEAKMSSITSWLSGLSTLARIGFVLSAPCVILAIVGTEPVVFLLPVIVGWGIRFVARAWKKNE